MTDGDISKLHLWSFIVDKEVITQVILSGKLLKTISPRQEKMLSNIPEDHQEDPGEIVEICLNPWQEDQMLIGYSAGFIMLWDNNTKSLLNILKSAVNLHHLCWKSEDEFYSSHSDGSYTLWDAENGAQIEAPHTPYGPYPCKAVSKFYCRETETCKWVVFRFVK